MIRRIYNLFKLQLNQGLGKFSFKKDYSRLIETILAPIAVIIAVTFILRYLLNFANYVYGFAVDVNFLAFYILLIQVVSFFITTSSIMNNLFFNKDSELLMSMPARHIEVFISKLLLIYVYDLIMNFGLIVPILISVGSISGAALSFYFIGLIIVALLPLAMLFFAGIIATFVMYYIRFVRNKFYLSILSIVVGVLGVFTLYMVFISRFTSIDFFGNLGESIKMVNDTIATIAQGNFIFYKIAELMYLKDGLANLGIFAGLIIGLGVLCFLILRPVVFRLMFMNFENTNRKFRKVKEFKEKSKTKSIIVKDGITLLRSSGYLVQFFLFAFMMPFIVYIYNALLMTINVRIAGQQMIVGANFLIIALIALISNTYVATAISKEGGNFYIMKITPTSIRVQARAKIAINMMITLTSIFITCVVIGFTTRITAMEAILTFIVTSLLAIGHACWSCEMDIARPILDWYDTSEITKANRNVSKSITSGLIMGAGIGIIAVMVFYSSSGIFAWIFLFLIAISFAVYRLYLFHVRIDYLFDKIEL